MACVDDDGEGDDSGDEGSRERNGVCFKSAAAVTIDIGDEHVPEATLSLLILSLLLMMLRVDTPG